MKNRFGKIMVLLLFVLIFVVACTNAAEKGLVEAVNIGDSGLIVTKEALNFNSGDLLMISNMDDFKDLEIGKNYKLKISDELATTMPPTASISEITENLGDLEYLDITFNQTATLAGQFGENTHLIDVRTKEEYDLGHVPGAINIPLDSIENEISSLTENKDSILVVYCQSGNRSKEAAQKLVDLGYNLAFNAGGIKDFKGEIEI